MVAVEGRLECEFQFLIWPLDIFMLDEKNETIHFFIQHGGSSQWFLHIFIEILARVAVHTVQSNLKIELTECKLEKNERTFSNNWLYVWYIKNYDGCFNWMNFLLKRDYLSQISRGDVIILDLQVTSCFIPVNEENAEEKIWIIVNGLKLKPITQIQLSFALSLW